METKRQGFATAKPCFMYDFVYCAINKTLLAVLVLLFDMSVVCMCLPTARPIRLLFAARQLPLQVRLHIVSVVHPLNIDAFVR